MKQQIYIGKGISEQIKHVCKPIKFTKETLKHFSDKYKKYQPLTSNYILMGSRMCEMYTLLMKKENKQIDPNLADLKIRAIIENAYLYPGWNYLKYPQADLSCGYSKSFTNEKFEEYYDGVEDDGFSDPYLIFVGRERDL